ncbi:hypothetical protein R1sor_010875 [Riccia sorocarpa]|uniref:Uncharacterized protein n=1 Tax=Riccia sorocarpa TaxID=122646 RepID=A0ABD3I5C7_9MARC
MAAQAGAPLHFDLYTKDDNVNYIKWKWISKKEAHRVLRGIDARLLKRSCLHDALWMDWARPEEVSSTIGGREVPLTIDILREYFLLLEGLNALRTARHFDELSDWVLERSKTAKTWSCRQGRKFGLGYIFKEIRTCKKQMQASLKRKVKPTCIGIVVLHILMTCGILDDEDIVLSDSDKSVEEVTPPRSTRASQVHVLSSSTSLDRVQNPSISSPERVQVSSRSSPERVLDSSSNSPERRQLNPDPRDIQSSRSPGHRKHASPTNPDRQHSPDLAQWRLVLLGTTLLAMGHRPAPTARKLFLLIMNLSLGLDRPWCCIRLDDDDEEVAIAGLTSLGASDPSIASKGKQPWSTEALLNRGDQNCEARPREEAGCRSR